MFKVVSIVLALIVSSSVFSASISVRTTTDNIVSNVSSSNAATSLLTSVVYEDVKIINGTDMDLVSLGRLEQGNYHLALTDFEFPSVFDHLEVALTTATEVIERFALDTTVQHISDFSLAESDSNYYIAVFGAASQQFDIGMYGIELTRDVSAVPLPSSVLFFLSGLAVMGYARNRRFKAFSSSSVV
jgi:hypothetical protein